MDDLVKFFFTHREVLLAWVFWPAVSAAISLAFKKRTPAEWHAWAQQWPALAFVVEFARANGLDIAKNALLVQRYAHRKSGKLPEDVWADLPVPSIVKQVLRDERLRGQLVTLIEAKTNLRGEVKLLD